MARAPKAQDVLREILFSKISYYQPKIFHELHQEVVDDYGPVTDRTVYRNLAWFIDQGLAHRVLFEDDSCYLKLAEWKPAHCQTDVDTDDLADSNEFSVGA